MGRGIVYKVTNKNTDEAYVGITTKSIEDRKKDHVSKAKINHKGKFYCAIATYGEGAFKWEQIDTATSTDELAKKEKEYILEYNSKEDGYNSDVGGGIQKTVYQYDLDGKMVNKFTCLGEAAKSVNSFKQNISSACLSETHFYKDGLWSYDYKEPFKPDKGVRMKRVIQFDLDANYIAEYKSVSDASKQTDCNKTSIAKVCRGERKSCGGYFWSY
jgi:hypothetical protein